MKTQRVSVILGLFACLPLASSAAQDIQTRFAKSLKDAQSLVNVEIEVLDTLWMPHGFDGNEAAFSRTFQYSYIAAGPKHRATCKLISGTKTNLAKLYVSAFDGKSYRGYDGDTRYMVRATHKLLGDRGQSQLNPLIAPFMFLTKQSDECRQCMLLFSDIVTGELTNGFVLPNGQSSAGSLAITFPGPPLLKQPTAWEIALHEAAESFSPQTIRRVLPGAGSEGVYKLLNYTNLGAYHFPTRIEWTSSSNVPPSPPSVLSTGIVTVISARIPDHIPDSLFTLESEEKSAATLWDLDQKKFAKSVHKNSDSTASLQPRPNIYDESSNGVKQIADALDIARKEHKHILLQFGANYCVPCHKLHELFQTNTNIAEELKKHYVIVMIDTNKGHNKDIDAKYGHPTRFGLPAIVVLDTDGKQLTTQDTGKLEEGDHHSPEKVMAFLNEWPPTK